MAQGIAGAAADRGAAGAALVDSIILHTYTWNGLDGTGTLCPSGAVFANESAQEIELSRFNTSDPGSFPPWMKGGTGAGGGWKALLGQAASGARNVSEAVSNVLALQGGELFRQVHVTEGNFVSYCGPARLSWGHAMYAASWGIRTLGTPGVGSMFYHQLQGSPLFAAMHSFNGTFYGLCCGLAQLTTPNTPTGPGIAMGLLANASGFGDNDSRVALLVAPLAFKGNRNSSGPPSAEVSVGPGPGPGPGPLRDSMLSSGVLGVRSFGNSSPGPSGHVLGG